MTPERQRPTVIRPTVITNRPPTGDPHAAAVTALRRTDLLPQRGASTSVKLGTPEPA
jgi:hypothetical protein